MSHDVEVINAVAIRERSSVLLMPVMDVNTAIARLEEFQVFCAHYLSESRDGGNDGGDYGVIPGTKKKTLLKSGADKLCELYGLYDEYVVMSSVADWDKGLFDYTLKCVLKSRRDDAMVGAGVGSCSSWESKYRWRDAKRLCPKCGKATIIKGQEQYGGGWICWFKDGRSDGCKAKFADNDKSITDQIQGRVENPDIVDAKNTVLKMAKKRAKIDATIGVTRSSGIFTQDMEEIPMPPPAKTVPRTTEDIDIGGKAGKTGAPTQEGPPAAAETSQAVSAKTIGGSSETASEQPEIPGAGGIDKGAAAHLHRAFREALPKDKQKHATEFLKDWLRAQKIVNVLGEPSTLAILREDYDGVKDEAVAYARTFAV